MLDKKWFSINVIKYVLQKPPLFLFFKINHQQTKMAIRPSQIVKCVIRTKLKQATKDLCANNS